MPSMPRKVPSGHGTKSSILYLHSLGVRPMVIVRLSGHPLIQDSLRPNSSHGSNSSKGSKSSYDHHRANNSVSQGRAKGYEYAHYSSNHYVHKSSKNFSAYSYAYPNSSYVKGNGLASMPPFSYGARRVMNSLPPLQMWVVKKKN